MFEAYKPIKFVYFFESVLSSEIASVNGARGLEVGCIGHEGLSGHAVLLEVEASPHCAFMQAPGTARRISAADLRHVMRQSEAIRILLLRFVHVFMIQIAASALADGRFTTQQRLARWLLMCHDRLGNLCR